MLLSLLVLTAAAPQGSAEDYTRSAELADRFRNLVTREPEPLRWLDGNRLLLRVGDEKDVVLVDAKHPAEPLELGTNAEWVVPTEGDPASVDVLRSDASLVRIDLRTGSSSAIDGEVPDAFHVDVRPARSMPRRSRDARRRRRVFVAIRNSTSDAVRIDWLTHEGGRKDYGLLGAGQTMPQSTFEGHVFAIEGSNGRDHAWFRVPREGGVATITDEPVEPVGEEREEATGPRVFARSGDLWWRPAGDGDRQRITNDAGDGVSYAGQVTWTSNKDAFMSMRWTRTDARKVTFVESSPRDVLQPRVHEFGYRKPGDEIDQATPALFRIEGDEVRRVEIRSHGLFDNPYRISRAEWDAAGHRFTFLYNERGHRVYRWVAIDARSGEASTIVEEAPVTFVDYAHKTYSHVLEGSRDALWMSERSGWNHLYRVDLDSGELTPITSGEWVVKEVESVDDAARTAILRVCGIDPDQDPYHEHFVSVNVDTGELTRLTTSDGTHDVTFSTDGSHLVATWSRVDHAPVVELRRTSDGALVTELGRADDTKLREAGWSPPQRFVAKGRDGETDIWGVVHRPTNFDPSGSYPVIESIYAGPHGAHVPKSWRVHRRTAELAELGFVVVRIDGMGTNWRSKAFHDVAWKNLGDAGFPDRIAWIRALAEEEPALDLSRVGIFGGSAGGQNAMRALIAHGDFYKAAVADCGCHDNRMDKIWWNELWMSWPIGPHYEEASNVEQAHRLQGDLFLIVGEMDRNVDPASTMQVVDALIRADKDFELLVVPGGGHGIAESRYGTRRRRDFFVRKLLDVEPRW